MTQYRDALFQSAKLDDVEAVRVKVAELERNRYKLSEPELTAQEDGANLLHYALENGHEKVNTLIDVYVGVYLYVMLSPISWCA